MTDLDDGQASIRADKWLWYARVLKSRTLAAKLIEDGKVRLNREKLAKPSQPVRPGDTLTITVRGRVRILEVISIGTRRGPATEAATLYLDLTPAPKPENPPETTTPLLSPGTREPGSGRPTKRDRREIERFRKSS